MPVHICSHCKASFTHPSSKRVYCNKACYTSSRIGVKRPIEIGEKVRAAMIGKKYDETRRRNIGLSRVIVLSPEKIEELKTWFETGMPDGYILRQCDLSLRVFTRYKKELYPSGIPWQCKWLENDIELCVVEEVVALTKQKMRYKRIATTIGLCDKTVKLILTALGKKDPAIKCHSFDDDCWSGRKESTPEKHVRELLDLMGVVHSQEVQIEAGSKWFFDFQVTGTKLLIEVQGDYWHCNPKLYPKPINKYQEWARRRDFAKRDYANKLGYRVLPIWENALKTSLESVKLKLEEVIKECKAEQ